MTGCRATDTHGAIHVFARRLVVLCAVAVVGPCAGCRGEIYELLADAADVSQKDAAPPPVVDAAGPTGPVYFAAVQRDLDALGCSAGRACHGGTARMRLIAGATDAAALLTNYNEVKPRASAGPTSLLLVKVLDGSGTAHAGPRAFSSTADAAYRRWLAWIEAGAPFAPDGGTP